MPRRQKNLTQYTRARCRDSESAFGQHQYAAGYGYQDPYSSFAYWPSHSVHSASQHSQYAIVNVPVVTFVCHTPATSSVAGIEQSNPSVNASGDRRHVVYSERPPGVFTVPSLEVVEDEEEFEVVFRTMSGKERKLAGCRASWPVSELQRQIAVMMEVQEEFRLSIFTKDSQLLTDDLGKKISEFGVEQDTELSVVLRYVCGPCGGLGCVFCNFGDRMTDEELLAHTQRFAAREAVSNGRDWWDIDMGDQRRKDQLGIFG